MTNPRNFTEGLTLKTNYQPRPLVNYYELTEKQQAQVRSEYDYMENPEDDFTGFIYHGEVYTLDQFMRTDDSYWHAVMNFTIWSGLLIHIDDTGESVVVAYYYC